MVRLIVFVSLALAAIQADPTQVPSVLRIRVSLVDADQRPVPLARHALLVGDDPPTAAPRRVLTTPEGTAEIRLRPGKYMVESDRPATLQGRGYQWIQSVNIVAGRDATLELTIANAEVGPAPAEAEAAPVPLDEPPASPAAAEPARWEDGAVTLWTEHRRAGGAVVSSKGLVATNESAIGTATSVEVQLSPTDKVAGRVVAVDPAHDLAIVEINPAVLTNAQPAPLACGSVDAAVCAVVASAEQKIAGTAPPSAVHLPVEPAKPLPPEMRAAASATGFSLLPYTGSSSDFDILFITPGLLAAAKSLPERTGGNMDTLSGLRAVIDFGAWSQYVAQSPPVLFIRATPKLVESFWMKLARGAAVTQGALIPPIKTVGPGFSRMRVICGSQDIAPVHPFRIRTRTSETGAVDEGFYAFDPMAIGPHCGKVSLVLSSVKDPARTETRVVDPAVIAQVWKDFAAWREK